MKLRKDGDFPFWLKNFEGDFTFTNTYTGFSVDFKQADFENVAKKHGSSFS